MFMIAHAYAKSLEYNKQFVIAKDQTVDGNTNDDYSSHIFRKIQLIEKFEDNHNWNPKEPSHDKHTQYTGYFQDERYFLRYSEAIRDLYAPPYDFVERIQKELPILNSEVTLISVRRGDYLFYPNYHPVVSLEYLEAAISIMPKHGYIIASDDFAWCRENLKLNAPVKFLEGYRPHEQMWIMSLCHHFIISNSSFSWWGAWLSRFENKAVMAPSIWFGPEGPKTWNNMYADGWAILESRFENGLIYPK